MRSNSNMMWLRIRTSLFLILMAFASRAEAQDARLPLLSEEIRTVLERDGVEAAQARFDEIFPDQKGEYEIDTQALGELAAEYVKAGDYEAGQAVARMMAEISQETMMSSGMMPADAAEAARAERDRAERKPSEPKRAAPSRDYGPAREDLARFAGIYGDPDKPDSSRKLFVTESCDGYLVAGAMWGDAQNWWMTSTSDNTFEMSSDFMSLRLEFRLADDRTAEAMVHDLEGMTSPLERMGPLPEGWGECLRRPGG